VKSKDKRMKLGSVKEGNGESQNPKEGAKQGGGFG
jgi:hypothetical protein